MQHEDCCGGKLLGHGSDAELRICTVGDIPFEIGRTVRFIQQDIIADRDRSGPMKLWSSADADTA